MLNQKIESPKDPIHIPEYYTIVNNACLWDYGTFKTHEELASSIFMKKDDRRYRSCIHRANQKLIENGKVLKCIHGKGYVVMMPDDYLTESHKVKQKAMRQFDRSHELLTNAPVNNMTEEGRQKYVESYDRSCMIQSVLHGRVKEVKQLKKTNILKLSGRGI